MCGILGIVNVQNQEPLEVALLGAMVDSMEHRGPDDRGAWVSDDGQCGLAHRRLSIVDLSAAGHQPMSTADRRIWVTFNGEIYNFPSLREDLESRGFVFRSRTDTEVILHLYRLHGERFIDYLDGDFALGLWDSETQTLILSRDRAGVKPLYYTIVDGRFLFASEIKALLRYPGIDRSIDPEALYHYLSYLVAPAPSTLISGIRKLEAATTLILRGRDRSTLSIEKYWEPLPCVDESRSFSDLDEELEALFSAAVQKRLMADVPVGVLFSGGVDSTLNVCSFGKLVAPEKVKTFTIGMENGGDFHDDSTIAREMASQLGTEHHEVRMGEDDLLRTAESLAQLQDEPISDPVAVPLYFVTKLARENGVTVLQAGEGADELFCGYSNYRRFLSYHDRLWRPLSVLPRSVSRVGAGMLSISSSPLHRKIRDVLLRRARGQELFMSSAVAYYEMEKDSILSPGFRSAAKALDSFDVVAPYYERLRAARPDATILQQITFIELQLRLPELLLMRADKMSMANSVEVRVPFLDRDLMDFAMRVPDSYKLRDGISKEPVKRLATRYVPREQVYRPKTGFGVPIRKWFSGRLGTSLVERLGSSSKLAEVVDRGAIERRVARGPRTVNEAFQLWVIYNLLVWEAGL